MRITCESTTACRDKCHKSVSLSLTSTNVFKKASQTPTLSNFSSKGRPQQRNFDNHQPETEPISKKRLRLCYRLKAKHVTLSTESVRERRPLKQEARLKAGGRRGARERDLSGGRSPPEAVGPQVCEEECRRQVREPGPQLGAKPRVCLCAWS